MQEARVGSLDQEDPLEEGMATHSGILAWRILMDRGAWQAIVHRIAKSQTRLKRLNILACIPVQKYLLYCKNKIKSTKKSTFSQHSLNQASALGSVG